MTIKTLSPEAQTHQPANYDFAAVGIVVPGATILHPSVAGHTDEIYEHGVDVREAPKDLDDPDAAITIVRKNLSVTHDGVLTEMHKFANSHGILGVPKKDVVAGKNAMVGFALEQAFLAIDPGLDLEPGQRFAKAFASVVPRLNGAFSVIAMYDDALYVARDRFGLSSCMFVGSLPSGGFVASSQEQSLAELNARVCLELEPGTLARIGAKAVDNYTRWAYPVHDPISLAAARFDSVAANKAANSH